MISKILSSQLLSFFNGKWPFIPQPWLSMWVAKRRGVATRRAAQRTDG
jgi:hypothetical protein